MVEIILICTVIGSGLNLSFIMADMMWDIGEGFRNLGHIILITCAVMLVLSLGVLIVDKHTQHEECPKLFAETHTPHQIEYLCQ